MLPKAKQNIFFCAITLVLLCVTLICSGVTRIIFGVLAGLMILFLIATFFVATLKPEKKKMPYFTAEFKKMLEHLNL